LLEYESHITAFPEETMSPVTDHLLKTISQKLARIPVAPEDLPLARAQLASQLDGLERLDELDLMDVEPATVLLPPAGANDGV
jgi:hypothetical protein